MFDGITEAVRVVVRRIDTPPIARPVMGYIFNAIGHRIEFAFLERDFHTQSSGAFVEHAVLHVLNVLICVINIVCRRTRVQAE